jgi:hypothetical protein
MQSVGLQRSVYYANSLAKINLQIPERKKREKNVPHAAARYRVRVGCLINRYGAKEG